MSAFARPLRSWTVPPNSYFNTGSYSAYDPRQPQGGYFNTYGGSHYNHHQPQNEFSHHEYFDFAQDEGNFLGKLGNLDVDGFPSISQMRAVGEPVLAPNKISSTYAGADEYLRTHFELMEEDFMFQLRVALNEYIKDSKEHIRSDKGGVLNESKGYENVRLMNFEDRNLGGDSFTTCVMDFGRRYEQPSFGTFLVFFKSGDKKRIECVGMVLKDAKQTEEEYSEIRLHFDDASPGANYEAKDCEHYLGKHSFYVLEPNHSFFLSYYFICNTLNGLYNSNTFHEFRMSPYILYGSKAVKSVKTPEYLGDGKTYKMYGSEFAVLEKSAWPRKPDHLNPSQYTALQRALTEELALVQGPPGTGKTYFGVELVKVLLENISNWNPKGETPLLILCHSNHALDHFLEGIHEFTDKYVRVGLRCESETIKPKCLVELVCRDIAPEDVEDDCTCEVVVKKFQKLDFEDDDGAEESDEDSGHGRDEDSEEKDEIGICESKYCNQGVPSSKCYCMNALRRWLDLIDETREQIRSITKGIVNFKTLQLWGVIDKETADWFEKRRHENGYFKWLGLNNIKVESRKLKEKDNAYLLVSLEELKKRIEKLNPQDKRAKQENDDKNKIVSIIEKFGQSSREDIFGDASDIFALAPNDTRKIYVKWLDSLSHRLHKTLCEMEKKLYYNFWDKLPRKHRYQSMLKFLKSAHVVGLTSTGAAARRNSTKIDKDTGEEKQQIGVLEKLASPIVILEEAAQILESHVVASMTIHCKHLIMLGDHQQLKPCINAQHLASKSLNVSLFERLLRRKIVTQERLTIQNRMRPEIADLLRPHYYDKLEDAPSTADRPPIRGLRYNMFFIDHTEPERTALHGNKGFWNPYEQEMLLKLSQFLVTMGYLPSQITIISMYNEQRRRLIEEREKIPSLRNLEITSVDGFQGKENEIILLSLVRSNVDGNLGFLDEENRICVALSRARSGLYIIGNMKCLTKHDSMWRKVSERLEEKAAIGPVLNLICDKHKVIRPLSAERDWECSSCATKRKERQRKRVRRSNKKK